MLLEGNEQKVLSFAFLRLVWAAIFYRGVYLLTHHLKDELRRFVVQQRLRVPGKLYSLVAGHCSVGVCVYTRARAWPVGAAGPKAGSPVAISRLGAYNQPPRPMVGSAWASWPPQSALVSTATGMPRNLAILPMSEVLSRSAAQ